MALKNLPHEASATNVERYADQPGNRFVELHFMSTGAFVRCSVMWSNFSNFLTALIFLWLLSLHQGKESDNMLTGENLKILSKSYSIKIGFSIRLNRFHCSCN
jgi:hypothetical protein